MTTIAMTTNIIIIIINVITIAADKVNLTNIPRLTSSPDHFSRATLQYQRYNQERPAQQQLWYDPRNLYDNFIQCCTTTLQQVAEVFCISQ